MQLFNFRDLGGLTTKCKSEIKPGLLFRTGNVAHWSDKAGEFIAKEKGIQLYIDLRNPDEHEKFGRPEVLIKNNIQWKSLSINTSDKKFESIALPKPEDWIELYQNLFIKNLASFSEFIKILAESKGPIMYGCLFGKDRTGIATSLLLDILDVHDQLIAEDYAKTTDQITPLVNMFEAMFDRHTKSADEVFKHYSISHEHVILAFLEFVRMHPDEHIVTKELKSIREKWQQPLKSRLLRSSE